jgi:hypothetical protein
MVLFPKPGRSSDSTSAFRPVCLLDQAVKLLERIVAARLESHLSRRAPGLHDSQFGSRKGRPTADAIAPVRSLIEGAVRRGCVALAVSPDVVNAFNSISWDRICRALEFHRMPAYLRGVVRAFLRDLSIVYIGWGGRIMGRAVCRDTPQDSGPFLWDIAYDAVLRAPMPPDSALPCYADDTLVLVWIDMGQDRPSSGTGGGLHGRRDQRVGARDIPEKSEAIWFCRKADYRTPPTDYRLGLVGARPV